MKIVQFPAKMNSKIGPTMGRSLIGCCPMATANRSLPHSGPILSSTGNVLAPRWGIPFGNHITFGFCHDSVNFS